MADDSAEARPGGEDPAAAESGLEHSSESAAAGPDPWATATPGRPAFAAEPGLPSPAPGPDQTPIRPAPRRPGAELRVLALAARDGLIAIAAALVVAFVALLVVVYSSVSHVSFGFKSFYTSAAELTGGSFGVPDRLSMSADLSQLMAAVSQGADSASPADLGGAATPMPFSVGFDLRMTVWLLPILALTIVFLLGRRAERKSPAAAPGPVLLRALVSGVAAALGVLVLALTSHQTRTSLDFSSLGKTASALDLQAMFPNLRAQTGLATGFVFLGPPLLVFLAATLGRAGVWLRVPSPDRRVERLRAVLGPWAAAARSAWLQARIVGVLAGLVLWVRVFIAAADDHTSSGHLLLIALAGVLLLGNLAVYGAFLGFGVPLTAALSSNVGPLLAGMAGGASPSGGGSPSGGASPYLNALNGTKASFGLFSPHGEWIVWLLFAVAVIGTLAPVLLGRRFSRFAVRGEDYPLSGFWRPIVIGALGALVVVVVGALSMKIAMSLGTAGDMAVSASIGPNLFVALGVVALWFLFGYLAIALATRSPRPGDGGAMPPAEPENPVTAALAGAGEEIVGS